MSPLLDIRLLGDFSLHNGDQPVTSLNSARLQSLLAYLVLHCDVPQPRHHLAFLFWPDTTEAQARTNLRQLVHQLRQALPAVEHFLAADMHMLHWHPDTPFRLDVAEFEQALQQADEAARGHDLPAQQAALQQADALYHGALLPSCYDDWIVPERERLRQRHVQALEHLLYLAEQQGDRVTAIKYAHRLLQLDPLSEDRYRHLMRLHALNDDRASALRVYHTCATTLQRELGIEPDAATRAVYEHLLHQETPTLHASAQQPAFAATSALIGRQREWEALQQAWQRAAKEGPHFVLMTGEAGIGKSRLAEEFLGWASQQGAVTARTRSYAAEGQLSLTLPPRVQAVLAHRLLHLSAPARELVGLAATVGRAFTLDLLMAAGNSEMDSAVSALDELWQKRIVREHGAASYDFTHDKLREVAYAEVSVPQRRLLHRRVAQALEALYTEDLDAVSGQLAFHYERAGLIEQALSAYQRAAIVAQCVYANEDAIHLLLRGLELLKQLKAGAKHDRQELRLYLSLAPLYRVTKGWAAPELGHVLDRTLALCDTVGDDAQRAEALYGLQSLYAVQARLEKVQSISDELQTCYQHALGTAAPPFSGMMLAGALLHLGRISDANERFAQIIAAPDPDQLLHLQESQGVNYAAHVQAWQSHALWCLGYPQQALDRGLEAIRLVQHLKQPFNQALVSAYLALLQQLRADEATARASASSALALTSTYQAPYYRTWAAILVSYSLALEQPDEGHIERLRAAIGAFKASSARLRLPYYLSLLAQVCAKAGRAEEGLAVIDEALAEARANNERWWNAEAYRLRGEFLRMQGADAEEVEAALLRAIETARSQQARSLELRASMSLARLWRAQDRADDARQQLSDVYAWFTEGYETPDLQAARLLLAHL